MKAVLELTKPLEEATIFYRYNVDGVLVWFAQYSDGDIYSVSIRPNEELQSIDFYIHDGSAREVYYPEWVEISTCHEKLNVDSVDDYVEKLKYAKKVAMVIEDIFNRGVHKECYEEFHKEVNYEKER